MAQLYVHIRIHKLEKRPRNMRENVIYAECAVRARLGYMLELSWISKQFYCIELCSFCAQLCAPWRILRVDILGHEINHRNSN